jgi:endothelin-converting enzyme
LDLSLNMRKADDRTEDAPLLNHGTEHQSLFSSLLHPPRRLSNLEKLLAAVSIILLILMSTFIGLFASAEKHLKTEKGRHDGGGGGHGGVVTTTEYATKTTTVGSSPTGSPEQVRFFSLLRLTCLQLNCQGICLTAECVKLSASILSNLNTSVDPCDDFYQYAST